MVINRNRKRFFRRVLSYTKKIQVIFDLLWSRNISGKLAGKFMILFSENLPAHFYAFIADIDIPGAGDKPAGHIRAFPAKGTCAI
jgi:hypothetical protein